ncbi:hypothetical protein COCSUDRAFT_33694, partial [Coccomyxa subellipsoidea C-169]
MINQKEEFLGLKDCTEQALDHSSLQIWQGVVTTQCLDQTPSKMMNGCSHIMSVTRCTSSL